MSKPVHNHRETAPSINLGPDAWLVRVSGDSNGGRFDLLEATISYLEGPPLHIHYNQEDTFYVLEGTLKIQVGDELIDAHAGDVVSAPKGVPHTFANLNKEPVRVLNLMTPGGFDHTLEELSQIPAGETPPDPGAMAEFGQRHGFEVVGPPIPVALGLVG